MTNLKYGDRAGLVVNEIDNSEVALAHSVAIGISGELLGAVRPGISRQTLNAADESLAVAL